MIFRSEKMKEIKISTEYIKLDQFLKFSNLAQTGGHAKIMIGEGLVKVNGLVSLKRGSKLKKGDIIEVEGQGKYIIG